MESRRIGSIRIIQPAYLNRFGRNEHQIILAEFPLLVNPLALFFQVRPFIENYHWKPERKNRFMILDRQFGKLVSELTTEAFFAFYLDTIESERSKLPTGTLTRYALHPHANGPVKQTALAPASME